MDARLFFFAATLAAVTGCSNPTPSDPDGGPMSDTGTDAQRDCLAVCVRSASSPCECQFPCGGHLTTATCNDGTCACTFDGAPSLSYSYTTCGPDQFIPGCHPELSPDAGADAGPAIDAAPDDDAGAVDDGGTDAS
jgi:hypothetical protein